MIPDLRDRELAERMRTVRVNSGMSANHVSAVLGISQGQMSRMESGQRRYTFLHAATLLGMCSAPAVERNAILELVRRGDLPEDQDEDQSACDGCWVRPHDGLPAEAVPSVLFAHSTAASVSVFHPDGLPMMLRARELLDHQVRGWAPADAEIFQDAWEEYRELLKTGGPDMLVYLHETALRSLAAPDEIREAQFIHLAILLGQQHTRVRVVPDARETVAGAFSLMRFAGAARPAVCVPCDTVTLVLEGEHVSGYQRRLDELDRIALSESDSQDLIVKLIDSSTTASPLPVEYAT